MKGKKGMVMFAAANLVFLAASAIRLYLFITPCRLEADCRGCGADTEWLKQWEEQQKDGGQGILKMAAWQVGSREEILAVSTKRKESARPLGVYGSLDQVFSADLLSGTWGLTGREDACVLSRDLAEALFGSTEVTGEQILLEELSWTSSETSNNAKDQPSPINSSAKKEKGKRKLLLVVAGVMDREGKYLLVPMSEGTVETVAVLFERRFQAEEKMREYFPFADACLLSNRL